MFKATITNVASQQITNMAQFATEAEAQAWVAEHSAMGSFGRPAWDEQILISPAIPRHLSEDGLTIIDAVPAVYETVHHPAEFTVDISPVVKSAEELRQELVEDGKRGRLACEAVLDFVAGHNRSRNLSVPQILAMRSALEQAEGLLRAAMPATAKSAIAALPVDGEIVTSELKAGALALLADF